MEKDITPKTTTWKFRSREVEISEMDKVSVLYAALHCQKRMYYYGNQIHYAEYRIKTAKTDKETAKFEGKKKKADDLLLFFAGKLEQLEEQAQNLGFDIPEKFEDLKAYLAMTEKEEKKSKD